VSNVIRLQTRTQPQLGPSKGAGVIVIRLNEDGTFDYRHRGSLSHIEKIGMPSIRWSTKSCQGISNGSK
jgi:hypothetical protein